MVEHPLREGLRVQLMTALHRSDRQADALAVYHDGRRRLTEELGVDPGAALLAAYQAVLRGEPRPRPESQRPAAVAPRPRPAPAMLPPDLLDFTGRGSQLAALREVLEGGTAASQAVVTGMPGAGKTALAVRAAHACRAGFPDGQLYVDLGGPTGEPVEPYTALGWFLNGLGVAADSVPATLEERVQFYRSHLARQRVLVELADAHTVRSLTPDLLALREFQVRGVIVTAAADSAGREGDDFVSASSPRVTAWTRTRSPVRPTAASVPTGASASAATW